MEKIKPFKDPAEAISSLDNGGRFYNIFTHPNDEKISESEVGKVAGVFFEKQKSILFMDLAIAHLAESAKEMIRQKFDNDLQASYNKFKAQELQPAETESKGIVASNVIISGIPRLTNSKSRISGVILVPVASTFTMIPITEYYDVYEISDNDSDATFVITTLKGKEKLPEKKIKVGGVLKELKKIEKGASGKFLEVSYFVED
ncbi:MAG: hypothetical protein QM731_03365 [Chitinophagaceae bacterium]